MSTLCLAFVKTGEDCHAEVGFNAFKKAFFSFFWKGSMQVCTNCWVRVFVCVCESL